MSLIDFCNKFSVGVSPKINDIDTPEKIFDDFFKRTHKYLGKFYFVAPLGKMKGDENTRATIYSNLKKVKNFNLKTQMQLFIHDLKDEDIIEFATDILNQGIQIDEVSTLSCYYQVVKECFPSSKIIYDPYNRPLNEGQILETMSFYDGYILDNPFNRNHELIKTLKENGKEVTLLLNSGCVPNCPGCLSEGEFSCPFHRMNYYGKVNQSQEEVFASECIMPYELHNGMIDVRNVDYIALSPFYNDPLAAFASITKYLSNENTVKSGEWQTFHPDFVMDFKHLKEKHVIRALEQMHSIN